MSGIVLSNAVRQNLSSLQATADMLATTQSRLSSGKKVNSALDNPTNFFTAASLDARASDINNLLDGIGNGVQILQAANTGITSLNKLVDSAKSIANQALQTVSGYSTKSNFSTTIAGATADDVRGTTSFANATGVSNVIYDGTSGGTTAVSATDSLGGTLGLLTGSVTTGIKYNAVAGTAGSALTLIATGAAVAGSAINAIASAPVAGDTLTINGKTLTFTASGAAATDASGNVTIGVDQTLGNLLTQIDTLTGGTHTLSGGGAITLTTGAGGSIAITGTGTALSGLGLSAAGAHNITATTGAGPNISTTTKLFDGATGLNVTALADNTTLSVNGKTITFKAAAAPASDKVAAGSGVLGNIVTDGAGNSTIYMGTSSTTTSATVGDVLTAIDLASGVKSASISAGVATFSTNSGQTPSDDNAGGKIQLRSSTGADLSLTGSADFLKSLGLTGATGAGNTTLAVNRTTSNTSVGSLIQDGSTLNVNGKTITFKNAATPAASATHTGISGNVETDGQGNSTVYLQTGTVADVLKAIDLASGVQTATLGATGATLKTADGATNSSVSASGTLKLSTGTAADLSIAGTGNALSVLGLTGASGTGTTFTANRAAGAGSVDGKTLTFGSFKGGTAVNITFGDGTNGTVKSLAQLNVALAANNMTAAIDNSTGKLTISTSNDYASHTLGGSDGGAIGGTLSSALTWSIPSAPVADVVAQTTRAGLVKQFNDVLDQIATTAQDASFNGVNLLNGDTL
jgi:hypothetical protein